MVSPLVALMRDQLNHLPPEISAAMLWRGQTKVQAMQVLGDLAVSHFLPAYASEFALQNKLEVSRHASSKHILPVTLLWSPHHFKACSKRSNTAVRKPYIVHERRILMLAIISEISFFFLGSISALVFQAGKLRILYVAPERLHNETLLASLKSQLPLPLLVVDGKTHTSRKDPAKEVEYFYVIIVS